MPSTAEQAAAPAERAAAVAAPSEGAEPGNADDDQPRTETASATGPDDGSDAHLDQRAILGGRPAVFPILADKRQQVQGLLAELHGKLDERGLMLTVPGELLFAVGSEQVQASAYDTLSKVAELIGMYQDRQVLISGHSDSDGNAADNQRLSERRAEVVKEFFVDNFDVAPRRLSTQGLGEARPIASNATPHGRRANRRVEVLILN
jgi:outer membrane protein OmpA-like peptidoglycan-associated protein